MIELTNNLLFLFQRLNWLGLLDIALVGLIFFIVLIQFRGTQAATVLRGIAILLILVALMTSFTQLPAFSWVLRNMLPAFLVAIPVVFAPEIRRTLERVGRADFFRRAAPGPEV